jgi:hypothetical protein
MDIRCTAATFAAATCLSLTWIVPGLAAGLDPASAVKAALGGVVIDKIFQDADQTIANAVAQAQNAGNGLLMHAADQASVLEQNAKLVVGDQRQKTFDSLDASEQDLLVEMEQWRRQVGAATNAAYDIVDTVNLDTSYQLSHLPFTHVPDFFVQSVHGVAFLKQPGDYKVTLDALNLGIQSDRKSVVTVVLDQKPLAVATPDQSTLNRAVIAIPNAALAPYFQPDHLATVPMVIKVTMTKRGLLSKFVNFRSPSTETYEVPVFLTLYPDLAATVSLEVHHPHYDWVSVGPVPGTNIVQTPNKNGCKQPLSGCAFAGVVDMTVPSSQNVPPAQGDRRIDSFALDCVSRVGQCNFSLVTSTQLTDEGSHATISFLTYSYPVQMRVLATAVSEYRRAAQDDVATYPMGIYFDHSTQVSVPGDFDLLIAHVTTFTGKHYDFQPDTQPDPTGLVVKSSITPPGSSRYVVLTANEPTM